MTEDSSAAPVQRTIGDGHDLTSPRFALDERLEKCFDDEGRLGQGARGDSVVKVQQALVELGYDLGPTGADGAYGSHTAAAVRKFKKDEQLGFEQFGDVGPGTMGRLNELFPAPPVPPDKNIPPCPPEIIPVFVGPSLKPPSSPAIGLIPGVDCRILPPCPDDGIIEARALADRTAGEATKPIPGVDCQEITPGIIPVRFPPKKKQPPVVIPKKHPAGGDQDVAFLLDDLPDNKLEAKQLAATVKRVRDKKGFAATLKALPGTVRNLYVISHGTEVGSVKFVEGAVFFAGSAKPVPLREIAAAIEANPRTGAGPSTVVFRGCRVGKDLSGLLAMAKATRATTSAANCKTITKAAGPVTLTRFNAKGREIGSKKIQQESDLRSAEERAAFDEEFKKMITEGYQVPGEGGTPVNVANCIVGLVPGEAALSAQPKLKELYFRNNGSLVATYTNPCESHSAECLVFGPKSKCFKDLPPSAPEKKCGLVEAPLP